MIRRNDLIYFFIGIISLCSLTNCNYIKNKSHKGFVLQNFKVNDSHLRSIIRGIKDSAYILDGENNVIVMELGVYDNLPLFSLSSSKKNAINEYFIFSCNARVVGYIEDENIPTDIIVLSDINSRVDFEMAFYKFLTPTKEKKSFEYIYFPDDQYYADEKGFGSPPPFFDAYFYHYIYKDGKFIPINKI